MSKRDDLFQKFGPILLEAFIRVSIEETNRLRQRLNMPTVTPQDFLDEIENHLSELTPYDWMTDEEITQ